MYTNVSFLVLNFCDTLILTCNFTMKASFPLFLVVLLGVAEALPNCDFSEPVQRLPIADSVNDKFIYDPEKIASHYDYIIVGGGLTGLTTAARLTDNPNITVLVIESGFWESDRSIDVSDLTHYGCVFGTTMDHKFATKIQTSDDRSQIIHSGRGLGGSTLINGGSWSKYPWSCTLVAFECGGCSNSPVSKAATMIAIQSRSLHTL